MSTSNYTDTGTAAPPARCPSCSELEHGSIACEQVTRKTTYEFPGGGGATVVDVNVRLAVDEALELIGGARMKHYGDPRGNLADIAAAWTPYVRRALKAHPAGLTGTDVCALMIILKVIRQARGHHRDSTVDVIGYAELSEILNDDAAYEELLRRK